MWGTIANLKENLNKIAQDVHDDEDDSNFEIYAAINGGETTPLSDRRNSHGSARSRLFSNSPLANGIDPTNSPEVRCRDCAQFGVKRDLANLNCPYDIIMNLLSC